MSAVAFSVTCGLLLALVPVPPVQASVEIAAWVRDDWTAREGLPSASLRALGQSADGFLWAATSRGVARFDGSTFARAYDDEALSALTDSALEAIAESPPGVLWFASDRGGGVLRVEKGRVQVVSTKHGLPHDYARALAVDAQGAVWVGTAGGLARLQGSTVTSFGAADGLPDLNIKALAVAPDGTLWVGTARGVARASGARFVADGPGDLVRAMAVTRDGRLWVGTTDGLLLGDATGWRRLHVEDGLPSPHVTAIAEDEHGGVWIGTSAGIVRQVQGRTERFPPHDPLATSPIRLVFADAEGGVWVALGGRFGLVRLRQPRWKRLTTREGLSSDDVRSVHAAPDGAVWLGTARGLDRVQGDRVQSYGEPHGMPPEGVSTAMADGRGRVWVVTVAGRLYVLENGRARPFTVSPARVLAVHADGQGPVHVASEDRLVRIDQQTDDQQMDDQQMVDLPMDDRLRGKVYGFHRGTSGRLYVFTKAAVFTLDGANALEVGRVPHPAPAPLVSMAEGPGGVIWGATESGGLLRLSGPTPRSFRLVDGLYSDRVRHLLFDGRGWLWVSSPDGLFRVPTSDLDRGTLVSVIEGGTPELSVGGVTARHPAAARTGDGRLHFATARGLLIFEPTAGPRPRTVHPVIERVSVNGRAVNAAGTLDLERGARVAFTFTAPALDAPEEVRFRSRLRGLESAWVDTGGERTVSYSGLPSGRFHFELQASAGGGPWIPAATTFALSVPPAVYARPWFLSLCLAAVASALFGLHRLRLSRARQRFEAVLEERNRIAREVHDTLAQSFVAISVQLEALRRAVPADLAGAREPLEMASQAVDAGIEGARSSVRALRSASGTRTDLVSGLRGVANLLSGATSIQVIVTGRPRPLPASSEEHLLRLGQEAMTNAVRHGRASSVRVELAYGEGTAAWRRRLLGPLAGASVPLTLTVADDGVGFVIDSAPSARTHGLVGMRERARLLGGRLTIDSAPGRGTMVRLELTS